MCHCWILYPFTLLNSKDNSFWWKHLVFLSYCHIYQFHSLFHRKRSNQSNSFVADLRSICLINWQLINQIYNLLWFTWYKRLNVQCSCSISWILTNHSVVKCIWLFSLFGIDGLNACSRKVWEWADTYHLVWNWCLILGRVPLNNILEKCTECGIKIKNTQTIFIFKVIFQL